jgi:predicted dehydrogenase
MINVGIIGYGYWGPNLSRNFSNHPDCTVAIIADFNIERLKSASKSHPSTKFTTNPKEIIDNSDIDVVVISTPVFTHFELAKDALNSGKHVFVEKPLTASSAQSIELIELALRNEKILMVDHTFLYTGAIQKIKSVLDSNELGELRYFDSTRINLGLFQQDINVLWDLAPHDISILNFLVNKKPLAVSATGISHAKNNLENIAYLTLFYEDNFIAHFNCSWTSPVKIRKILIGGSKKMIVFDDVEPTEKVKIYDTGYSIKSDVDMHKMLVDYRIGDIYTPKINTQEALSLIVADFVNCIKSGTQPLSNGQTGLDVVKILEVSTESIKHKGKEIRL